MLLTTNNSFVIISCMKKITKANKIKRFLGQLANNDTAVVIFVTVLIMSTMQAAFLLALFGQWARVIDQLVILVLIGVAIKLWRVMKQDAMLITRQQDLIDKIFEINKKQEEIINEKQKVINKQAGHLAQAKGELNKKYANTKKEQK